MIGKNTLRKRASAPNIFKNALRSTRSDEQNSENLQERIQKKAYELYEKRGCVDGNDLADWLEAERLVRAGKA